MNLIYKFLLQWDFVCDRRWMGAVSQSAYMLGVFAGAVTLGTLADKLDRLPLLFRNRLTPYLI
jgi:hypothetical protein